MSAIGDCLPGDDSRVYESRDGLCYELPKLPGGEKATNWKTTAPGFIGKVCNNSESGGIKYKRDPNMFSADYNSATFNYRDDGTSCWVDADSFGRGAGTVPDCAPGYYKSGLLCYPGPTTGGLTPSNATLVAGTWWANCSGNTTDTGAFCEKNSYGRGAGTPSACRTDWVGYTYSPGWGSCWYGWDWNGSDNCNRYDKYNTVCGVCPSDKVNQDGLCYSNCETGYKGVGPVCWADSCPSNTRDLGTTSCAKNSQAVSVAPPTGYKCNKAGDELYGQLCYPNCVYKAKADGRPFSDKYYASGCCTCQRDPKTASKNVVSRIGTTGYGSCDYPVSSLSGVPSDKAIALSLNEVYTSTGCVPDIDDDQPGGAFDVAGGKAFVPQNGEYQFIKGAKCGLCSGCYGKECLGGWAIDGVRPAIKRTSYKGGKKNCCISGAKTDGANTCDPSMSDPANCKSVPEFADYCSTSVNFNSNQRCQSAYLNDNAFMDKYCDVPGNFSNTPFCQVNYKQTPYATKELTPYGACSKECGGGTQLIECLVKPTTDGSVKAVPMRSGFDGGAPETVSGPIVVNNTIVTTEGGSTAYEKDAYDFKKGVYDNATKLFTAEDGLTTMYIPDDLDACKEEPLEQECNTQNCILDAIQNDSGAQFLLFIFIIILAVLGAGFFVGIGPLAGIYRKKINVSANATMPAV